MILGERGAQRGHHVLDAGGMQRERIHVAFHDQRMLGLDDRAARMMQRVQRATLREQRGIRAVEVLGLVAFLQRTGAEGDAIAQFVVDREHQAAAETVDGAALARADQAKRLEAFAMQRFAARVRVRHQTLHMLHQVIPAFGACTKLEQLHGLGAQFALGDVRARRGAQALIGEALAIEAIGRRHGLAQRLAAGGRILGALVPQAAQLDAGA